MPTSFQMAAASMFSSQYPFQNFHNLFWPNCFFISEYKNQLMLTSKVQWMEFSNNCLPSFSSLLFVLGDVGQNCQTRDLFGNEIKHSGSQGAYQSEHPKLNSIFVRKIKAFLLLTVVNLIIIKFDNFAH